MTRTPIFVRRRAAGVEPPVELRFVDMLLIIIASLMFVTILLSVISAFTGSGRPDVAPVVTTEVAPDAIEGERYQLTLAALGGDGDYVWKTVDGGLPEGLGLTEDGTIEGTPAKQETGDVSVQVKDGSGRASESRRLNLRVRPAGSGDVEAPPFRIADTVALLPEATAGQAYEFTFNVDGSDAGYTWKPAKGEFPEGLKLSSDGTLAGRPAEAGTVTVTVAMSGNGDSAKQRVRLEVAAAPDLLLWRILDWMLFLFTWGGRILLAIIILNHMKATLFGRHARNYYVPSKRGIFGGGA